MKCDTIYSIRSDNSVPKFTNGERTLIKNIVANLSIKKIPEVEIMKAIFEQTKRTITRKEIYNVRRANQKGFLPLVQDHEGRRV